MSETPSRFTAPLQVVLMFVIIIATILLGFLMMPSTQEERDRLLSELGTTNHGTLLTPVKDIAALNLSDSNGDPWLWSANKAKWRLLIPGGQNCEDGCDKILYTARQVHVRLGKNSHRLERVFLALDGEISPQLAAKFKDSYPYQKTLYTDRSGFAAWLADTNSQWAASKAEAILVDPSGVAMMVYDEHHSGNDMLEDINHLLKYSPE